MVNVPDYLFCLGKFNTQRGLSVNCTHSDQMKTIIVRVIHEQYLVRQIERAPRDVDVAKPGVWEICKDVPLDFENYRYRAVS